MLYADSVVLSTSAAVAVALAVVRISLAVYAFLHRRAKTMPSQQNGGAAILGLGTSVKGLTPCSAEEFVDGATRALESTAPQGYLDFLCKRTVSSGIATRHFAGMVHDWCKANMERPRSEQDGCYGSAVDRWNPKAGARQELWAAHAPRLAIDAARNAIENWGGDKQRITHIVFHSCTGFKAPGVEVDIMDALELKNVKRRTGINFMGCFGGMNGLSVAKAFVDSVPGSVCLLVCVEICSSHFALDKERGKFIGNTIFGDGAAAAVVGPARPGDWILTGSGMHVMDESTRSAMSWFPTDHAYEMYLDKSIGPSLGKYVCTNLDKMLDDVCGTTDKHAVHWAIHPGGKGILEAVMQVGVSRKDIRHSWHILENYGNMSSASILFVLKEALSDTTMHKDKVFMLAFGPGLTIETAGLARV